MWGSRVHLRRGWGFPDPGWKSNGIMALWCGRREGGGGSALVGYMVGEIPTQRSCGISNVLVG